jgi:cytosine deaminase
VLSCSQNDSTVAAFRKTAGQSKTLLHRRNSLRGSRREGSGKRVSNMTDQDYMNLAWSEAKKGLDTRGVPVGSVLVRGDLVLGKGFNQRVQKGDAIAHGEMDCIRNAGRLPTYRNTVLYTTLSPCMMCSGTIVQFKIPRVVVGENKTFGGNEDFLRSRGIEVVVLDDPKCKALMDEFIRLYPEVWNEDIGEG